MKLLRAIVGAVLLGAVALEAPAQIQRLLGLDISDWQGNISKTVWSNFVAVENRHFVLLRSSRGGTTGCYNENDSGNTYGTNTLSQRYDDPYYIQNINRATAAGMFAGSYHFTRADIIETTKNSGGIRNSGTNEADHFMQMAGPWMRPGYLIPVNDFEAGIDIRTDDELATFCRDFSNRIYEVTGIRPAIYMNGNYNANIMQTASSTLRVQLAKQGPNPPSNTVSSVVSPRYPYLWSARWPNQTDPGSIDVQNGEPKDSYTAIYGPWDDYGITHPWKFWQYASTMKLPSYSTTKNLDVDVARGGVEFVKDQLIPAVWMNDSSGDWSTLANWNSGMVPITPEPGTNQPSPATNGPLPTPRLPGEAGSGPPITSGTNDTVILERPDANITVTLSAGDYNIRKLYLRETLNITGGSLTVNFVPSADSTTNGAQFSGSVTLSGSGSFSVHTLQVDTTRTFTLAGGTLTFDTINLMPHSTSPAKILVSGDVALNPGANATSTIAKGSGSGTSGSIDLGADIRGFDVSDGAAEVDVSVEVPISNGGLTKTGAGTLRLSSPNAYGLGTTVSVGRLLVNNTTGSGTGTGEVIVNGILGGTGTIAGAVTVNDAGILAPGTASALGSLTLNAAPTLSGATFVRVNRNGGAPLADKLVLSSGTLTYGGTLVVSNAGAPLTGGEVFTNFNAGAYSGAFAATNLPALSDGSLNWYLGDLTVNGTIRVNRPPVANGITVTNTPGHVLRIPIATLLAGATDADSDLLSLANFDPVTTNGISLSAEGDYLYYFNSAVVTDQFGYTVSDGHGATVTVVATVVSKPNSAPVLEAIADCAVNEGTLLLITNVATDDDLPNNSLVFSLGPGAPDGAAIDPASGIFSWRPSNTHGPSTNLITMVVTDDGVPPLSATQQFAVAVLDTLSDFTLSIGSTNVFAGESNTLPVVLTADIPLTNMYFELRARNALLTNLALRPVGPEVTFAELRAAGPDTYSVDLTLDPKQQTASVRPVATVDFLAVSNYHSAVVPMDVTYLVALRPNDRFITNGAGTGGRVIIVSQEPVLDMLPGTPPQVRLYGWPGLDYSLLSSTELLAQPWPEFRRFTLTDRFTTLPATNDSSPDRYFRGVQYQGQPAGLPQRPLRK